MSEETTLPNAKGTVPSETGGSSDHVSKTDRRQEYAEKHRMERKIEQREKQRKETEMRKMSAKLSLPYAFPLCADVPAELVQLLG